MNNPTDLHHQVLALQERVQRLEKTNAVLMKTAEGKAEAEENAFDLFKANGTLEEQVAERTARLKQAQHQLLRSLSLVRATLEASVDGILVIDLDGQVVDSNRRFWQLCQLDPSTARVTDACVLLQHLAEHIVSQPDLVLRVPQLPGDTDGESALEIGCLDGRTLALRSALQRMDGKPVGRIWSVRDITERKQAHEQLRYLASVDSLTGLSNRPQFHAELALMIEQARDHNGSVAVMFLDLDRFKSVNDTLGHAVGDQLLREVAARLKACVRQTDLVARQGGDEFALALGPACTRAAALSVAQKIKDAFALPFHPDGHEVPSGTSIGIAFYPKDGADVDSMLRRADAAMYAAKAAGRGGFRCYDVSLGACGVKAALPISRA